LQTGCHIRKCYEVEIDKFEISEVKKTKSCKFGKTGEAEVFHTNTRVSYIWKNTGTNEIVSTSKRAKGLVPGHYSVYLEDYCGYNLTTEYPSEQPHLAS
jgi:hypothetical protein